MPWAVRVGHAPGGGACAGLGEKMTGGGAWGSHSATAASRLLRWPPQALRAPACAPALVLLRAGRGRWTLPAGALAAASASAAGA
eukprot:3112971-Alexandrium_andersonii.AAC.1